MKINEVKEILSKYDTDAKKQFGQNFLLDDGVISRICDLSFIDENTNVVEIGPGLGFLTKQLAKRAKKVLCYEIDPTMIKALKDTFNENDKVTIINQDFLKCNIDYDVEKYLGNERTIVVANLPYYITTAILLKILEESKRISQMTVMMQQEVADRICGKPSTKDYNSLSVLLQYYTNSKEIIKVSSSCFYPKPLVDSAVVKIEYKEKTYTCLNEEYFKKFNRAIFTQRRKTISNNIKSILNYDKGLIIKVLNKNNIKENVRAEALTVEQIIKLANDFYLETK